MKSSRIAILAALVAACASFRPTPLQGLADALPRVPVAASSVAVADMTRHSQEGDTPILGSGFQRVADREFAEPLGAALARDLGRLMAADGTGAPLEVSVLDGGFAWEKTGGDYVPLLNFFTYGRNGRFRCAAHVAVRQGARSWRFEAARVQAWNTDGLEAGDSLYRNAARACYPALLREIAGRLARGE